MSAAKHTPGPWKAIEQGYDASAFYIYARNSSDMRSPMVAHIPRSTVQPMEANARLIAAAPELLSALLLARAELPIAAASWNEDENPEVVRAHVPRVLALISAVDAVLRNATGGAA